MELNHAHQNTVSETRDVKIIRIQSVTDVNYENIKKRKVSDVIRYDPTPAYSQQTPVKAVTDLLNAIISNSKQYADYELDAESEALLWGTECSSRTRVVTSQPSPTGNCKGAGKCQMVFGEAH
ncbi:hypothetical protein CHS0354_024520 [Potamilus streckersoni]|uniref:Uncharacterized protein n=1 Tax=Potamilus streckersoni TaxID=2493646 RepID=A0AAE0WGD0_9BIVA|nr:hypothetical protein CHS0354_024520 [Potamilus streckersoni]